MERQKKQAVTTGRRYASVREMLVGEGAPASVIKQYDALSVQAFRHTLKSQPEFFGPIKAGLQCFDVRQNDRDFQIGDEILLREFAPCAKCGGLGHYSGKDRKMPCHCKQPHGDYTGQECLVRIKYILFGGDRRVIIANWCVLGLEQV